MWEKGHRAAATIGTLTSRILLLATVLFAVEAMAASHATPVQPDKSVEELLHAAQESYATLDYDEVVPIIRAVLAREGLGPDQKLDAYLLLGSSQAVIGDPVEAETAFRLLLRGRPDFNLPDDTAPKILAVFRKVQNEERSIAEQLRSVERQRIIAELVLIGGMPGQARGGYPLAFAYRLRDTRNAVEAFSVWYRRHGEPGYSALALQRDGSGTWRGTLPGEWTASEQGFVLEFYLETRDGAGPLLVQGSTSEALRIQVAPGNVEDARPPPLPLWSFVATAGTAVGLGLAATGTAVATVLVQQDHDALAERSRSVVQPGDELIALEVTGARLALATTILWVATGVAALAAGGMAPFVDWENEKESVTSN
ncbi:MAG: hypothetical protein ABIJ09_24405 [Pseudomonadota bacterium]